MLSHFSRVRFFAILWTTAHRPPLSMGFTSKNTGVSCYALLQGIFPTQEPKSFALEAKSLPSETPGKPSLQSIQHLL